MLRRGCCCLPSDDDANMEGYFDRHHLFWCGIPTAKWGDHFLSVELSYLWRRHLIWSKPSGRELRDAMTQRFASVMVFLSLILGTEIRVLFSPSKPADAVRIAFKNSEWSLEYFTGVALCLAIFFAIAALVATFSAWGVFSVIGDDNLKLIARSSIGLYAAQLPNRLVTLVIYSFYLWVLLFWWIIMPLYTAAVLTAAGVLMIVHIVSTYSALARIIMDTGAMSRDRVLEQELEDDLMPPQLGVELLKICQSAKQEKIPVHQKYKDLNTKAMIMRRNKSFRLSDASNNNFGGGFTAAEAMDVDFAD